MRLLTLGSSTIGLLKVPFPLSPSIEAILPDDTTLTG